jgi:hypothetical protein
MTNKQQKANQQQLNNTYDAIPIPNTDYTFQNEETAFISFYTAKYIKGFLEIDEYQKIEKNLLYQKYCKYINRVGAGQYKAMTSTKFLFLLEVLGSVQGRTVKEIVATARKHYLEVRPLPKTEQTV